MKEINCFIDILLHCCYHYYHRCIIFIQLQSLDERFTLKPDIRLILQSNQIKCLFNRTTVRPQL